MNFSAKIWPYLNYTINKKKKQAYFRVLALNLLVWNAAPGETSDADAANLEFARKQTILALNHLSDELQKEDPALLRKLGWTRAEAEAFLRKWQSMHADAATQPAVRDTLSRSLQNLGLRPAAVTLTAEPRTSAPRPTTSRDTNRIPPPDVWAEQYDAYTRGVAGGLP